MLLTLIVFIILSYSLEISSAGEMSDINSLSNTILNDFYISPILFVVPAIVILLAFLKVKPVIALSVGIFSAIIFSIIFQNNILSSIDTSTLNSLAKSVFTDTSIPTENLRIQRLYDSGGMKGMLWTIYLTIKCNDIRRINGWYRSS